MGLGSAVTSTPAPGRWRTAQLTGAGLALIAACYGLARFSYGLFVPVLSAEFELTAATAGAIASGSYAAYCLAIVASTALTPRLGSRTLAISAGVVATVGVLLIALAPNAMALAIGVIVAGSSTGIASPPLAQAIATTVRERVRDRAQTVVNAGTRLGVLISAPVALVAASQWRLAWFVFAGLCAAVTLWVAFAVPGGRPLRTTDAPSPAKGRTHRAFQLQRLPAGSGRLVLAAALMGIASSEVWTFGRDLLVGTGGMTQFTSTVAWILLGAFGMAGAAAGGLVARLGVGPSWTATMILNGAATVLFAALPGSVPIAWGAAAVFGATYIGLTGILLVWGTQVYMHSPATGVGLAFLVLALGQAAGTPLVGSLSTAIGPPLAFAVTALVGVAGAFVRPARRCSRGLTARAGRP